MKSIKSGIAVFVFLLSIGLFLSSVAHAAEYVPGQVLVLLKNGIGKVNAATLSSASGESYVNGVAKSAGANVALIYPALSEARGEIFTLMTSDVKTTEELLNELRANPKVRAVSPNYIVRASAVPNDPYYTDGTLWGMNRIKANEAWNTTTGGDTVYIAVADSGIYAQHEDLAGNLDTALSKNFTNGTNPLPSLDSNFYDGYGHGTHVSGTIGAVGDNGKGVVGVNWRVRLIALKVLGDDGTGYTSWSTAALDYLVGLLRENPAMHVPAVNLSLGGYAPYTPEQMQTSAEWYAYKTLDDLNRTVIVVAAGNEALEVGAPAPYTDIFYGIFAKGDYGYPASFIGLNNMVVVGATDSSNQAANFSNWSAARVHFAAPGVGIMSTVPLSSNASGYSTMQGTSMATPHVTGAVGLLASQYPNLSARLLKSALLLGADGNVNPIPSSPFNTGGETLSSNGLLEVKNALEKASAFVLVTGISLTPEIMELEVGGLGQLSASIEPSNASEPGVVWISSNTAVASVSSAGRVTAVSKGTATITARALGANNMTAYADVIVTGSSPVGDYAPALRSAGVQSQLNAANQQLYPQGVTVDFGSLNNAMDTHTPSNEGASVMRSINKATLSTKSNPGRFPSGFASTGKPAAVIDVDATSVFNAGGIALVPVTLQYTFDINELTALFGATTASGILANPAGNRDIIFGTLTLQKEVLSGADAGSFEELLPGAISPQDAIDAGILLLEGGRTLKITFSFLVSDSADVPTRDQRQLIVPDGATDGYVIDPVWLTKVGSGPVPGPVSGGSGGCNGGFGIAVIGLCLWGFRRSYCR